MSASLSQLQANLAGRLGKDVFIITVSKDPETDTPERLNAWGKAHGIKPGWTMVTGEVDMIGKIVRNFTGDRLGKGSHNGIFLIGSDKTGRWTGVSNYGNPEELLERIDMVMKPDGR